MKRFGNGILLVVIFFVELEEVVFYADSVLVHNTNDGVLKAVFLAVARYGLGQQRIVAFCQ